MESTHAPPMAGVASKENLAAAWRSMPRNSAAVMAMRSVRCRE
jgi:hypothetical protein